MSENGKNAEQGAKPSDSLQGIELEVAAYLKMLTTLSETMEKLEKLYTSKQPPELREKTLKVVKEMCISIENSLPLLRDFLDNLSYMQDENTDKVRSMLVHIEDDLLPRALEFIRSQGEAAAEPVITKKDPVC